MNKYIILTDSSCDLNQQYVEDLGIQVIPLTFEIAGKAYKNYIDEREMTAPEFYEKLRAGDMSVTSQVNVAQFAEFFEEYLKQGYDVLYLSFSSGLSGTYNSSCIARDDLKEIYPNQEVICVDTLCASLGQGLLIYHAVKQRKQNKTMQEVATWVEENKLNLAHWFTVEDLNFLKRGGRVSGAAAFVGTMLSIKPVMHMDDNGKLIPMEKARGRKASIEALANHIAGSMLEGQNDIIFISHGDCPADAQTVVELLKEKTSVTEYFLNNVGPVIGGHSGPGTLAVFALCNKR